MLADIGETLKTLAEIAGAAGEKKLSRLISIACASASRPNCDQDNRNTTAGRKNASKDE